MLETQTRGATVVRSEHRDGIAIVTIDNPPVNALSFAVSAGLLAAVDAAEADPSVVAVVFTGANGTFSGGADINEFLAPPPPDAKNIRDAIARVERCEKTFVAAIDGNALGGGCELALACDYRVATPGAKLGLPEIRLGLLPGAGGTQRLTRLLGARSAMPEYGLQTAMEMMLKGESKTAKQAKGMGLVDFIAEGGDLLGEAIAFARAKIAEGKPKARVSELTVKTGALPFLAAMAHKQIPFSEEKGGYAAHKLVDAVEAAVELDFKHGLAREARIFDELVRSDQARAYMHIFFAERELAKIPGLPAAQALEIHKAAVVGAGTMGTGIAMNFANAKIPVSVIDVNPEQVERGKKAVADNYADQVKKGRMTADEAQARTDAVHFVSDYAAIADADIVVEAVFESMAVKKQVFEELDAALKPDAVLATNTSTLDIDTIAQVTKRPQSVVGTHFFAPANIMKLLEVVRGSQSSPAAIATAMKLGKTLKKVGVLSGNAFGFIGNRMLFDYAREANYLIEEGALPSQVDRALRDFGFVMGPFQTFDLSGLDVFHKISLEAPPTKGRQPQIVNRLYEQGRYGQKTGKGFYRYDPAVGKGREALPDPEVDALIVDESKNLGITRREIPDEEIVQRCMYALINQGAQLLGDGIALRPGDIDIVWIYGYGFPPFRGGPMWYADSVGTKAVHDAIVAYRERFGDHWEVAPLLASVAARNSSFANNDKVLN